MVASTTHFKLKAWKAYFPFMILTIRVIFQGWSSVGIVRMQIRFIGLRTLTVWETMADMKKFRDSGFHRHGMNLIKDFGSIEIATWDTDTLPTWNQAIEKLN